MVPGQDTIRWVHVFPKNEKPTRTHASRYPESRLRAVCPLKLQLQVLPLSLMLATVGSEPWMMVSWARAPTAATIASRVALAVTYRRAEGVADR